MYNSCDFKSDVFWKFYSGITQLKNIKIHSIISQEPVKSPFVKHKVHMLIWLLCKTENDLLSQMVGDHLHGVVDYSDVFTDSEIIYAHSVTF